MGTPGELKKDRMQDAVVEIRCDRPQEAIAVLGTLPGVRGAALFGNGIHAVVERGEEAIPALREGLAAGGFPVSRAERIVPSLEDVFVSVVEERDRRERPAGEARP
jgi:ABC-2 type transport system ATP-binding protein